MLAVLLAMTSLGCGPRGQAAQPSGLAPNDPNVDTLPVAEPVAEPATAPAAQPSTEKDVRRYIWDSLVQAGYQCNEDTPLRCMTTEDQWEVNVSTRVEADATRVFFESASVRAADKPCGPLRPLVEALGSQADFFTVDCLDSTQRFRMITSLVYGPDIAVAAWMQRHRESRLSAWQALDAAGVTQR